MVSRWCGLGKLGHRGWVWVQCGCGSEVNGMGGSGRFDLLVAANTLSDSLAISRARRSSALKTGAKVSLIHCVVVALWYVIELHVAESEFWSRRVGGVIAVKGSVAIVAKSFFRLLVNLVLDCIGDMRLLGVKAVALCWCRVLDIIFASISFDAVVGVIVAVGGIFGKSSSTSSGASAVYCVSGCCTSMAGGSPVVFSTILLVCAVVGIVVVIVGSISVKSSSSSFVASTVDCVSGCGSMEVEALAWGL